MRISDWSSDVCSSDLRTIFCPLPLQDGVSTVSGWPPSSSTRAVSIIALSANALPVSRWHQRQWQQCTNSGIEVRGQRTARQVKPPSCAVEIGRETCGERVCQNEKISVGRVTLKKKKI